MGVKSTHFITRIERTAEHAVVFLPTHFGLHGTHNVDKESITNIELP